MIRLIGKLARIDDYALYTTRRESLNLELFNEKFVDRMGFLEGFTDSRCVFIYNRSALAHDNFEVKVHWINSFDRFNWLTRG